jgi:hypothetical protein
MTIVAGTCQRVRSAFGAWFAGTLHRPSQCKMAIRRAAGQRRPDSGKEEGRTNLGQRRRFFNKCKSGLLIDRQQPANRIQLNCSAGRR